MLKCILIAILAEISPSTIEPFNWAEVEHRDGKITWDSWGQETWRFEDDRLDQEIPDQRAEVGDLYGFHIIEM